MRATTVRFGDDLWALLEQESAAIGVSVAQYIRDAALIRVVWEELRRDGDAYARAAGSVDGASSGREPETAHVRSLRQQEESRALLAQAGQLQREWAARDADAPDPPDRAA